MGKEFYFETDDRLDRKKYAEFLKTLLEHCDEYRREDSEGAYVIAIDSPWGTGKTRFAKMLRNYLENRTNETPAEAPIDPSKGFLTVYYNAWDTDFSNDALEPLIYSLINSPELESELFEKQADEEIENFIDSAKKVLKVIGLSAAHHFLGETVAKVLNDCNDEKENTKNEACDFKKRKDAIDEFRETLNLVIKRTKNKKLVIIVDELDRCRPNYAIQTLEIAKHLFNVSGLIFIFALDIKQLSYSVKTIYGQGMDSSGYLCRFFDYIGQMPVSGYIKFLSTEFEFLGSIENSYAGKFFYRAINRCLFFLREKFDLSLRDTKTIIKTYSLMYYSFLKDYQDVSAHELYLYLICLKYKTPYIFNKLLKSKLTNREMPDYQIEEVYVPQSNFVVTNRRINYFSESTPICKLFYETYDIHKGTILGKTQFIMIKQDLDDEPKTFSCKIKGDNEEQSDFVLYPTMNLEQILFYEDLKKWHKIKSKTIAQYYYQQLEMFNFALPSEEMDT